MGKQIKDVYIVHHSHTDVGYTDLQETVIYNQIHNIKAAVKIITEGIGNGTPEKDFRWNCETYYCVERFLEAATEEEKEQFFELVKNGNIGISATYLNFNDLADCEVLDARTKEMKEIFAAQGIDVKTAMNADINGISLGQRDVLIRNGIEFLYTNIHCHHGMYPLYQNQKPYFWESEDGKCLLVWSGEHYNLGNALGIVFSKNVNYDMENYFDLDAYKEPLENLHKNLTESIEEYETSGYPYDFYITSVSGVFSDNAPANPAIIATVNAFNDSYGDEVKLHMVSLQELYANIKDKVQDAPVYQGDLNDWWANGVGSTPYVVKHYKEAQRYNRISDKLEKKTGVSNPALKRVAEDNLLLYAEHTWGHSSTITNPYDTMVVNLDIRKNSYASKAHEAGAMRKNEQCHAMGDILRYYNLSGEVKAVSLSSQKGVYPVEFYVETISLPGVKITDKKTGEECKVQLSPHPRGVLVSFLAEFEPEEEKTFLYEQQSAPSAKPYTRAAYVGVDRVRDIVNTYDSETYKLPYQLENEWFCIRYEVGKGVVSFYNKKSGTEMLQDGVSTFFTPVYERTAARGNVYEERRLLGRNIRGLHAEQYQAELKDVKILEHGPVFDSVELMFSLEGTYHSSVVIKMYHKLPKILFKYKVAKTLSEDIESLFLPLCLNVPDSQMYIRKGGVAMRPGIDQLPGTNMEYYIADEGIVYHNEKESILINTLDTSLIYQGEMKHHPVLLCDNKEGNNSRPVYSWIMNNTWETNFKMDLSGFCEFCYELELQEGKTVEEDFVRMQENDLGMVTFMTK